MPVDPQMRDAIVRALMARQAGAPAAPAPYTGAPMPARRYPGAQFYPPYGGDDGGAGDVGGVGGGVGGGTVGGGVGGGGAGSLGGGSPEQGPANPTVSVEGPVPLSEPEIDTPNSVVNDNFGNWGTNPGGVPFSDQMGTQFGPTGAPPGPQSQIDDPLSAYASAPTPQGIIDEGFNTVGAQEPGITSGPPGWGAGVGLTTTPEDISPSSFAGGLTSAAFGPNAVGPTYSANEVSPLDSPNAPPGGGVVGGNPYGGNPYGGGFGFGGANEASAIADSNAAFSAADEAAAAAAAQGGYGYGAQGFGFGDPDATGFGSGFGAPDDSTAFGDDLGDDAGDDDGDDDGGDGGDDDS
jgi:hypothetical protein